MSAIALNQGDIVKKTAAVFLLLVTFVTGACFAGDLDEIKKRGVLRHLGVPYAGFVVDANTGLDVEMMRLFAVHLGLEYRFVASTWTEVIPDLIGRKITCNGGNVAFGDETEIKGDVIANGLTILPWRLKVVNYSKTTFPNQIWLISDSTSPLRPIKPSGDIKEDIAQVRKKLIDLKVLCKKGTCLDNSLYKLEEVGALPTEFEGNLNEIVPAVLKGSVKVAIIDVPDALVAFEKWTGQFLVIGPVSERQEMAAAFRPTSPGLEAAFNEFFEKLWREGTYQLLVKKYYPAVFAYYPDFFKQ